MIWQEIANPRRPKPGRQVLLYGRYGQFTIARYNTQINPAYNQFEEGGHGLCDSMFTHWTYPEGPALCPNHPEENE